jgi:7,8-dihydroneopterin aldolase/epimerase/oxygenase
VITIEVNELRLFGRHGVHAHEKENGQEFVFDVTLDVGDRGASDRLDEAVDYRGVIDLVQDVNASRSYDLLEALATAVVEALHERFAPTAVRVRVTKPAVEPGVVSVTASRP